MDDQETFDFKDYHSKLSPVQKRMLELVENESVLRATNFARESLVLKKSDKLFNYIVLCTALSRHHKSMSLFLLRQNCPVIVPQKTSHYCTPLHYAVKWRHLEMFKMFWKRGASVFDKDANDDSALELAMVSKAKDIIDFILDEICSKNLRNFKPDVENDVALFHAACWNGNLKPIEMFMSSNFSLNSRSTFIEDDWKGFTPLHFSMAGSKYYGRELAVKKLLLLDDIDLFATDEKGRTPVHIAFRKNVRYLLDNETVIDRISCSNKSQFINSVDKSGLSHFHIVCSVKCVNGDDERHIKYVKYFIDNGVDLNSSISLEDKCFPGYTALHLIVKNSCWGILELLLENGADPTQINKKGFTPLYLVFSRTDIKPQNRLEVVKLLLEHGADPVAKDSKDCTLLHTAFYTHSEVRALNEPEKLLLSKNEKAINYEDEYGLSYLHIACTGDDLNLIKPLVDNGALINSCVQTKSPRYPDYSALHFAVKSHQVNITEFLLSQGADVNCVAKFGKTPLHLACINQFQQINRSNVRNNENTDNVEWIPCQTKQIQMVELLLKYGAFVNAKDSSGYTALLHNCITPGSLFDRYGCYGSEKPSECFLNELFTRQKRIMVIFLRHGVDINICTEYWGTVLHFLCNSYETYPLRKELIELALENGANVNAVNRYKGFTPLHEAVEVSVKNKSDTSLIDLFLENGADANAKSNSGNTPLHVALQNIYSTSAHIDVLSKLLNHPDIDVNARNKQGLTPLHLAMIEKKSLCTKKLLECGADINIVDVLGRSPLHMFLENIQKRPDILRDDKDFVEHLSFGVIFITKLERLRLFVSEHVRQDLTLLSNYLSKDAISRIDSEIFQELTQWKSRKIDDYNTFYDILFKDSIAMAKHVRNHDFREAISSILEKPESTYLGIFMKKQYVRGCQRVSLLESAKSALNFLSNLDLPWSCSEPILKHVSDEDLKNLKKSITIIESGRKKSENAPVSSGEPFAKVPRLDANHSTK